MEPVGELERAAEVDASPAQDEGTVAYFVAAAIAMGTAIATALWVKPGSRAHDAADEPAGAL